MITRFASVGVVDICDQDDDYQFICFTDEEFTVLIKNGYQKDASKAIITCTLDIGIGRKELGAPDYEVFVLKIKEARR